MTAASAQRVRVVEVGPRDGLQNEPRPVSTAEKIAFVRGLVEAGLAEIEVTSFVGRLAVPQLADAAEVVAGLPAVDGVCYSALVPNMTGLDRASAAGLRRIAVFTAASDTFARHNINMTVEASLAEFAAVIREALARGMSVRGYLSTCFTCPYEGPIGKERVRELALRLLEMGVDEVAIGDTIGAAVPRDIDETVGCVLEAVPVQRVALHLHDTCGTALANVCAALRLGIRCFDASTGGLGGCPYAPGAAGNLATGDLVYLLQGEGYETGVDLERLFAAASLIAGAVDRELPGRQFRRLRARWSAGGSCPDLGAGR